MKRNPLLAANPGILASIVASPGLRAVTVPSLETLTFSSPFNDKKKTEERGRRSK